MTIKQAEQQDCGQYTVKISNKISEVNADFILSMKDKPEPPQGYVYFFREIIFTNIFVKLISRKNCMFLIHSPAGVYYFSWNWFDEKNHN